MITPKFKEPVDLKSVKFVSFHGHCIPTMEGKRTQVTRGDYYNNKLITSEMQDELTLFFNIYPNVLLDGYISNNNFYLIDLFVILKNIEVSDNSSEVRLNLYKIVKDSLLNKSIRLSTIHFIDFIHVSTQELLDIALDTIFSTRNYNVVLYRKALQKYSKTNSHEFLKITKDEFIRNK